MNREQLRYTADNRELYDDAPSISLPKTIELLSESDVATDIELVKVVAKDLLRLAALARKGRGLHHEANTFVYRAYEALLTPYVTFEGPSARTTAPEELDLEAFLRSLPKAGTCQCGDCKFSSQLLEVGSDSDLDTIKAYRELAKVWHPDRFDQDDSRMKARSEEKFKAIHGAYTTLLEHRSREADVQGADDPFQETVAALQNACFESVERLKFVGNCLSAYQTGTGHFDGKQIGTAIERVLALNKEALAPTMLLVPRIPLELPDFPVSDFVDMIGSIHRLSDAIYSNGVEAGLIQAAS